jgi:hypothetical protein
MLRERCPDYVEEERWRQCIADAEGFIQQLGGTNMTCDCEDIGFAEALHELVWSYDDSVARDIMVCALLAEVADLLHSMGYPIEAFEAAHRSRRFDGGS